MVLRPHLDDDEVEPIRALCLQNLRSLEDDPGTKVIYELRRRHFPDPWGRPSPGTTEGVAALTPDDLRRFLKTTYRPNGAILGVAGAIDWPGSATRSAGSSATGSRSPSRECRNGPPARAAITSSAKPSRSRSRWPIPRRPSPAPTTTAPGGRRDPGRLFVGPALHRGPREARPVLLGLRQLRGPARPGGHALLRRHLRRPAQETLDVMLAEIERLGHGGVALEELETMRAGLKSSLIMAQESSMSRSGSLASDWFFLGRVRPIEEIAAALDALTPEGGLRLRRRLQEPGEMTILTLGPSLRSRASSR